MHLEKLAFDGMGGVTKPSQFWVVADGGFRTDSVVELMKNEASPFERGGTAWQFIQTTQKW